MDGSIICGQCGTQNKLGDRFCEQCGTPLAAASPQTAADAASLAATTLAAAPEGRLTRVDDGEVFRLANRTLVGRLDSCDVPVNDKSVSREHALLSRLRDGYVIEDRGSTNGTLVNGQRINEAVLLHPGDLVTIGSVDFRYELEGAGQPPEAARASTAVAPSFDLSAQEPAQQSIPPASDATAQDLPPIPVDFPPLEPFAPIPDADAAPIAEVPAAELWREEPVRAEAPSPPAEAPHAEEPPPVPITTTAPPASVHAEEADRQPEASAGRQEGAELVRAAAAAVQRLEAVIGELTRRAEEAEAMRSSLESRVGGVDEARQQAKEAEQKQQALRSALMGAPGPSLSKEQLDSIQEMLNSVIRNPRDVELLMKMGQKARELAAVVNESAQLHRILDKMAQELGLALSNPEMP